ncbi:MAG: antibiotic biosynthesis monooxygenase [Porticoccaceae bacterium]|nr:antibiotic biosynthesis monooxygenase [Porticoccaceae bacterium]
MSCTVLLELKVKPECVDDVIAGLGGMLPETRQFEGCIEVYAHQDQDDPTTILAIEKWESRAAYEKYFAWRTETGAIAALGAWVSAPPSIRYFDKKV